MRPVRHLLVGLAAVALAGATALPGFAAQTGQTAPAGSAGTAAPAVTAQDRAYLAGAHQSNLAEIAAGTLARSRATDGHVRELGAQMVTDHSKLDATLRQVAATAGVSLPSRPNAEQRAAQEALTSAARTDFDALYVGQQLTAHAKTAALGRTELSDGSDAAVRGVATAAGPVIARHHEHFVAEARRMGLPHQVDAGATSLPGRTGDALPTGLMVAGGLLVAAGAVALVRRRPRYDGTGGSRTAV